MNFSRYYFYPDNVFAHSRKINNGVIHAKFEDIFFAILDI